MACPLPVLQSALLYKTQHTRCNIYVMQNTAHGADSSQCAVLQDVRSGVHGSHSMVYRKKHLCRSKIKWLLSAVEIIYRVILCVIVVYVCMYVCMYIQGVSQL